MYCPYCSSYVEDNTAVCPVCGMQLNTNSQPDPQPGNAGYAYNADAAGQAYAEPPQSAPYVAQPNPAAYGGGYAVQPSQGKSSQTLGILGVCFTCAGIFPIVSFVLSVIALATSGKNRDAAGQLYPEAKVGRVCGIIGTVFAGLRLLGIVILLLVGIAAAGSLVALVEDFPDIVEDIFDSIMRISPMLPF